MKMNAHASAGGVNASADRYAKYLGRRVHENTARVALRSAMAVIRAGLSLEAARSFMSVDYFEEERR